MFSLLLYFKINAWLVFSLIKYFIFAFMMTEENIKEALSIKYIETLANYKGFKTHSLYPDNGTDLVIYEVKPRQENGHQRYFDTGRELKIQLKATSIEIEVNDGHLVYDLNANTYNDLVVRINDNRPLILILFLLPNEYQDWTILNEEQLVLKKCAYYYLPAEDAERTDNQVTQRIRINVENIVTIDTLNELMERYG